jgi:hypothetical protein
MGFEAAKFGEGGASGSGNVTTQVSQHYGERDTGKTTGVIRTAGAMNELTLDIDAAMVSDGALTLVAPIIPAGSLIEDAYVEVTEAFVLGGTSPTILVGTSGSEVTNGLVVNEATAEATGTYDITSTLTGTWAAGLAADTTVGIDFGGTSPTVTAVGKMRVVVRYVKV